MSITGAVLATLIITIGAPAVVLAVLVLPTINTKKGR